MAELALTFPDARTLRAFSRARGAMNGPRLPAGRRRIAGAAAAILAALSIGGAAHAADDRSPLNYPLSQYALMLGTALLGGLVSWYAKVKRGELRGWSLMQLIGELSTSAFAGLLCFWLCEFANTPQLVTVSLVGIAGHMGTRAISAFEAYAEKRWGITAKDRR